MSVPIPFIGRVVAPEWVAALQQAMPEETVVDWHAVSPSDRAQARMAIVANPHAQDVGLFPALTWVHSVWAGVEQLVDALGDSPLQIVRLVDPRLAETMAEAILAWTMFLHRDMPAYARLQAQGQWQQLAYVRPSERTVGILGLGHLGAVAARRLASNGFDVCGWSQSRKDLPGVRSFWGADGLTAMLAASDIVVVLLPLTPQTRGLLDASRLAALRQGARIVNFARGAIIDSGALRAALDEGRVQHAVLDVFEREPLPAGSWEWSHPRVTVLPHISGPTDMDSAAAIVAGHVRAWRRDGVLPTTVDSRRGY